MRTLPNCWGWQPPSLRSRGYLLIEALVYLSLLFALMGVGFAALYLCIDYSVALRRNADEITNALHAGELWRADVRSIGRTIGAETVSDRQVLHLKGTNQEVFYAFSDGAVLRRVGAGPWVTVLSSVKASAMRPEPQFQINAWRWELELQPQAKGRIKPGRIHPLFTFIAVPPPAQVP